MSSPKHPAEVGGNRRAPYVRPRYGWEPWRTCPITGLEFAECEGVWSRGRWLHPLAVDERGYKERIVTAEPTPSKRRPWTPNPHIVEFF